MIDSNGVKNEMTMVKADDTIGEKIDDASITAQVKMIIEYYVYHQF